MSFKEALLTEFDAEMATTRKTLERVPDSKMEWRPHAKSFDMRALASHIANAPVWAVGTMNQDSFDVAPKDGEPFTTPQAKSTKELVEMFDANVAAARAAISSAGDDQFSKPWSLMGGGQTYFTKPRTAVLRTFIMNHIIHHRAQLGVYLRLNDVPVPSTYGPSADEGVM